MATVAAVESDFSFRKMKIAGVCLFGQLFGTSMLLVGPLSMLMLPMTQQFGWSRSQFSGATTAIMWSGALSSYLVGRLIDRLGVRPVILTGTILLGLISLILSRQTANLWLFYSLYLLAGVSGATMVGYGKILGPLFTQHRGIAMSGTWAVSSLLSSAFPQISNQLLIRFGWPGIFAGYGIVILATGVLLYFFMEEPANSRVAPMPMNSATAAPPKMVGMTLAEALRGKTLWIMIGSGLIAGLAGAGWYQHSFAFQLSRGFSQQTAVNAMTIPLWFAWIGVVLSGWVADKVQTAKIYIPFALMAALSVFLQSILWANHGGIPLLYTSVMLSSMAINIQMPMNNYFYTRFFGMKAFGEIAGLNMAVLSLTGGLSAPLIGLLYDRAGSYNLALTFMIGAFVASGLLYLAIGRYRYTTDFKVIPEPAKRGR